MDIEKGWRFSSADFSVLANGGCLPGNVSLVRCPEDKKRWLLMDDELKEDDEGPPLYVTGIGMTFEEAIASANLAASHALPIPPATHAFSAIDQQDEKQ